MNSTNPIPFHELVTILQAVADHEPIEFDSGGQPMLNKIEELKALGCVELDMVANLLRRCYGFDSRLSPFTVSLKFDPLALKSNCAYLQLDDRVVIQFGLSNKELGIADDERPTHKCALIRTVLHGYSSDHEPIWQFDLATPVIHRWLAELFLLDLQPDTENACLIHTNLFTDTREFKSGQSLCVGLHCDYATFIKDIKGTSMARRWRHRSINLQLWFKRRFEWVVKRHLDMYADSPTLDMWLNER